MNNSINPSFDYYSAVSLIYEEINQSIPAGRMNCGLYGN